MGMFVKGYPISRVLVAQHTGIFPRSLCEATEATHPWLKRDSQHLQVYVIANTLMFSNPPTKQPASTQLSPKTMQEKGKTQNDIHTRRRPSYLPGPQDPGRGEDGAGTGVSQYSALPPRPALHTTADFYTPSNAARLSISSCSPTHLPHRARTTRQASVMQWRFIAAPPPHSPPQSPASPASSASSYRRCFLLVYARRPGASRRPRPRPRRSPSAARRRGPGRSRRAAARSRRARGRRRA